MGRPVSDGTLTTTAAAIVTGAKAGDNASVSIIISQAVSQTDTVTVTMTRQGGTARQIAIATLAVNTQLVIRGLNVSGGDSVLAVASSNTTGPDYVCFSSPVDQPLDIFTMSAKGERRLVAPTS